MVSVAQREPRQHFPRPGWVEHDAVEIRQNLRRAMPEALSAAGIDQGQVASVGPADQWETTVLRDRLTGAPLGPVILWQGTRTAPLVEDLLRDYGEMDADAIRAAMLSSSIGGGQDRQRAWHPNVIGEKAAVTAFVMRRFVDRGLLVTLSASPDGTLHHPGQVDQVCRREDLTELVAADTPLGPEQATARLWVCRIEFGWMCGSAGYAPRSRSRSASAPAGPGPSTSCPTPPPPSTRSPPHARGREEVRAMEKGQCSPLAEQARPGLTPSTPLRCGAAPSPRPPPPAP
ncbi:FGGY family carbohydrate kinase [Streptomyces sp. NPDC056529]|uniref:FGGY family carbohydrate kinase n=1 Tax=Streptomyces sp. NPDC056529 TaxID=3345855 RepID=UPI0036C81624